MTAPIEAAPMGKMLTVFLGTLIILNLALAAFEYVLPDVELPGSIGILMMMAAAMAAGQIGGTAVRRLLTLKEKTVFSVVATLLGMAVTFGMLWAVFAWNGVPFSISLLVMALSGEMMSQSDINEMVPLVIGFMAVISLLICFFAVGWGARTQVKAMERKAAKAG
jgi:hypothetical protein